MDCEIMFDFRNFCKNFNSEFDVYLINKQNNSFFYFFEIKPNYYVQH